MMKKLSAVVIAVCLMASASSAAWDYFTVIEQGRGEARLGDGYMGGFKIRYGLMDNIELFATNSGVARLWNDYFIGGRYQMMPEMLALGLDVGIPTHQDNDFALVPNLAFTRDFTDAVSFGAGVEIGLALNRRVTADSSRFAVNLGFGFELDFKLSDAVMLWAGIDFFMGEMLEENSPDMEIWPVIGVRFSVGENMTLGTMLGIELDAVNREDESTIGFRGGVEFAMRF